MRRLEFMRQPNMNNSLSQARIIALPLFSLFAGLALTGCMVGPNYKSPPVQTTQTFKAAPTTQISAETTAQAEWWTTFNDPVLNHLVEMAYAQNLTLQTT